MSELRISADQDRTTFEPGEELTGTVFWQFDRSPKALELRLFWFTRGKGTEDAGVVETLCFDRPLPVETRSFRVRLPESPHSFSGRLISLIWALELVAEPSNEVFRLEIIVAPGCQEVRLDCVRENDMARSFLKGGKDRRITV